MSADLETHKAPPGKYSKYVDVGWAQKLVVSRYIDI